MTTYNTDTPYKGNMLLWLACLGNATMGMTAAGIGVVWPSVRATFGRDLGDFQIPLLLFAIGTIVPTLFANRVISTAGIGALVIGCTLAQMLSQFGAGATASWTLFAVMFLLLGLGTGIMDAALKMITTRYYSGKQLNRVYASWSLGAWLGSAVVALPMSFGLSWRVGFVAIGALLIVPTIVFVYAFKLWDREELRFGKNTPAIPQPLAVSMVASLRTLPIWGYVVNLVLLYMVVYNIGMLGSSTMVQSGGWDEAAASRLIVWYWGASLPGRLLLGAIADRMSRLRMVTICATGIVAGCALLHIGGASNVWLSTLGVLLIGFCVGPVATALTFGATRRVSNSHLMNINALQVITANVCWVGLPAITAFALGDTRLSYLWMIGAVCATLLVATSRVGRHVSRETIKQ